jgi:hypothetical protein
VTDFERHRRVVSSSCRYTGDGDRAKKSSSAWTGCPGRPGFRVGAGPSASRRVSVARRTVRARGCLRAGLKIHGENGPLGPSGIEPSGLNQGSHRTKLSQGFLPSLEILLGKVIHHAARSDRAFTRARW